MKPTTPGQSAQSPAHDLDTPATLAAAHKRIRDLGGALETVDSLCQAASDSVRAIAQLALLALESPEAHSRNHADLVSEALLLIHKLIVEVENDVNATAEMQGFNFIDRHARARESARLSARDAAASGLASEGVTA